MANSDSDFEVRIEQRAFNKGDAIQIRKEYYDSWKEADTAYCAYQALTTVKGSGIQHVELIEHRKTIVHKAASKLSETPEPLQVLILKGANAS